MALLDFGLAGIVVSLIVGLGILFIVDALGWMDVDIGLIEVLLVILLGGIPGAIVVLILVYFDVL